MNDKETWIPICEHIKMKWTKCNRASGLLEWVCEHGVGHPDYESAKKTSKRYKHSIKLWMIHGCCEDNCCSRDDFPGRKR